MNKTVSAFVLTVCFSLGNSAQSAEDEQFQFDIVDMPLDSAMDVVAQNTGIDFSIDGPRQKRVRNVALSGSVDDVLEQLMDAAGMDHFAFNGQVYASPFGDRQTRLVRLEGLTSQAALAALSDAGLMGYGYSVTEVAGGGALVLSGPIRFLAIAEGIIASTKEVDTRVEPVRIRRGVAISGQGGGAKVVAASE